MISDYTHIQPIKEGNQLLADDIEEVPVGWDEGGRSHCGYSDMVHDTLMSIGESMHSMFGEPSETLQMRMDEIGNYFQEISYAARDFKCGKLSMKDVALNGGDDISVLSGDEDDVSANDEEAQ
mmetsp:Transcript_19249/g.40590  ORF Transcript_19249/g.40590 Transcript_19249/m.40590 type:complete len:123 (+) Transcript_19249:96-464(+)|eukprot:CAMPEP_0183736206 /NCGR_PEP_ID=MMETSP0737-20130205/48752_1 /TAXON_ID=385413 /ORGANISM="Thalassiosira miniscula, Strain CCMP1093" /LENGTH=122 /DNA_ID=CAMNT_0025970151 /DNA_START=75 /DNA_END=443 /DNA_ORIENTATION=+